MEFRAAYLTGGVGTLLTGPEHSDLTDDELLAIARATLEEVGIPDSYADIDAAMADVCIDVWIE